MTAVLAAPSLFHSPLGLFEFQADSVARAYLGTQEGGGRLICWDTGCIYGDAQINVNRGGNGRRYSLRDVVAKFNGNQVHSGKRSYGWDPSIPTYVQCEADDGTIRLGRLVRAQASGVKRTYTLTTSTGRVIRATDDHQFMTERGWVALAEIAIGDLVHVRGAQASGRAPTPKMQYRQVSWLRAHPHANRRDVARSPHRVPHHRLVAEADLNELSYDEFIARIKSENVSGLEFLDPAVYAVHHKDHDHRNNDLSNLMVMTHRDHHRLHADEGKTSNVLYKISTEDVTSIEPYGLEETFDLTLEDEPHNFIANGFVVHNCGKSMFGIRMATLAAEDARDQVADHDLTIVLAEKGKIGEWVDDFHRFSDLRARKHLGANRWKTLDKQGMPDVLVTTYETARLDLAKFVKVGRSKRIEAGPLFQRIESLNVLWIADEIAAKLSNRSSAMYKVFDWTFRQRRSTHPMTHRVFGLTATPIESGYENAFNQGRLLFPDRMPTVKTFEERFVRSRHPVYRTPRYNSDTIGEFTGLFEPVIDRVRKSDPAIRAQFPDMVERSTMLEMGKDHARLYEAVAGLQQSYEQDGNTDPMPGLWTALRLLAGHPAAIAESARNGGSQLTKALVDNWGEDAFRQAACSKADELLERVTRLTRDEAQKVVVFTFFGHTVLPVLQQRMQQVGIPTWINHGGMTEQESATQRAEFKSTASPGVYLTSDAGCRGINLPEATHLFEYESALTFATHLQRINRIHRITSDTPSVYCTTLVTKGTVEVPIVEMMLRRNEQTDLILGDTDAGEGFMTAQMRKAAFLPGR